MHRRPATPERRCPRTSLIPVVLCCRGRSNRSRHLQVDVVTPERLIRPLNGPDFPTSATATSRLRSWRSYRRSEALPIPVVRFRIDLERVGVGVAYQKRVVGIDAIAGNNNAINNKGTRQSTRTRIPVSLLGFIKRYQYPRATR